MNTRDSAFWEENIPWTFRDVKDRPSYEERRKLRYALQDYMQTSIGFDGYKGKKVLEVGPGSGIDSAEFARNGASVTAVDFSSTGVAETERTFREANLKGTFKRADARKLPFPDGSFDLVYSFGVVHHIRNPRKVVSEFSRVLKRGGECICMLYNRDSLLYAYSIKHVGLSFERVTPSPYAKAYTKEEAASLFKKDFSEVEVSVEYDVIDTENQRKVKFSGPKSLGWHLIIRARK